MILHQQTIKAKKNKKFKQIKVNAENQINLEAFLKHYLKQIRNKIYFHLLCNTKKIKKRYLVRIK